MKRTKRIASVLLALVMALSLITTAFAAGGNSITVNGAQAGETYKIYKMLDLSVNADKTAYTYTVNENWKTFFETGAGKDYVDIDAQGYVTWKDGKNTAADMEAFGKAAAAFAAEKNISAVQTTVATTETVTFENLESGYYLITSTKGTLAMVYTTPSSKDVTVEEKNPEPTVNKQVKENSTGEFGKTNDANIGDTVEFKTTISAKKGAKDYVLHDKMSEGLTLVPGSVKVEGLTEGKDYTVATENLKDGCTFEITFKQAYLDTITGNTDIVVTYSATLNEKAVIADVGNPNETWLNYGDNSHTEKDTTRTYTWQMDVLKYTMKDGQEVKLADAKFVLYKTVDGKNLYAQADETNKITGWTENEADAKVFVTPENGEFSIIGLDAGTYYLKETEAPAGYNMLKDPIKVVITAEVNDATHIGTATVTYNEASTGTVKVENNTGAELPSTGGIGTTIFYVVGGLLVVAAGVLLVTRKRMNKSEN